MAFHERLKMYPAEEAGTSRLARFRPLGYRRPFGMDLFVSLGLYWGGVILSTLPIMYIDTRIRKERSDRADVPDLRDQSLGFYYVIGLVSGFLILPFYFGITRKTGIGWVIGIAWACVAFVAAVIIRMVLATILVPLLR
jgi:hypothetical protein